MLARGNKHYQARISPARGRSLRGHFLPSREYCCLTEREISPWAFEDVSAAVAVRLGRTALG